jgi:hypothetical protein
MPPKSSSSFQSEYKTKTLISFNPHNRAFVERLAFTNNQANREDRTAVTIGPVPRTSAGNPKTAAGGHEFARLQLLHNVKYFSVGRGRRYTGCDLT